MQELLLELFGLFIVSMLVAGLISIRFRGCTNKEKIMFFWIAVLICFIMLCVTDFVASGLRR